MAEGAPQSNLTLELEAKGGGRSLETLDGALSLRVPESKLGATAFGPIRAEATAKDGTIDLQQLNAVLPGVSLQGRGRGSEKRVEADLKLTATNLAALATAFGPFLGAKGLPIAGKGTLTAHVEGPTRGPAVQASGSFVDLRYGKNWAQKLELSANVPNLAAPLSSNLELKAALAQLGKNRLVTPRVALKSQPGSLVLDAATQGRMPLSVHLAARPDEDEKGLGIDALRLTYPGASWVLEKPSHVRFDGASVSVDSLKLRSGNQRLAATVDKRGQRVNADLTLAALDVAALPVRFFQPELTLGGKLDARLTAKGRLPKPEVNAKVKLEHGRYQRYTQLNLRLDAAYAKDQATGKLWATGHGVRLDADFDVPVEALLEGQRKPVKLNATVAEMDLEKLANELALDKPLRGWLGASVKVSGFADDPRLEVTAKGRELQYEQLPPTALELALRIVPGDGPGDGLSMTASAKTLGNDNTVELKSPWTLAKLMHDQGDVMAMPVELHA
jgi:translocation and assembly module TamB